MKGLMMQVTKDAAIVFHADSAGDNLIVTDPSITLGEKDRVWFTFKRGSSGSSTVSYTSYDAARNAYIEYVDGNADGTIDFRIVSIEGRPAEDRSSSRGQVAGTGKT